MMLKNKYESVKPLFEYIRTVPFDVNNKLQQGKFKKQLSLDLHQKSISNHFPLRYIDAINSTNSDKLIIPYHKTEVGVPMGISIRASSHGIKFQRSLNKPSLIKSFLKTAGNILLNKCSGKKYVYLHVWILFGWNFEQYALYLSFS